LKRLPIFILSLLLLLLTCPLPAVAKNLTIIHSNDMHSHLLGASPNIDYTPGTTGDDQTIGGWARIATVIRQVKYNRTNPVLVVDAGDFLMGSLFHMLAREQAFELQLLHMMGYDAVTFGNHEFDLKPGGLARILTRAHNLGQIPPLVFSNAVFSQQSREDDSLEEIFARKIVKPYLVVEKGGLKIGIFGIMGKDAAEVAPFADPVTFADPVATAKRMVGLLRETEKVDMVVCLSHSGLSENKKRSEDEILAREVSGIDIIISGHTHTKTSGALRVNNTIIVQSWEYGKQLGVLDVAFDNGRMSLKNYRLIDIDDTIEGDAAMTRRINEFEAEIDRRVLAPKGLAFRKIIAQADFDLFLENDESNLGNLIADSMRWYVRRNNADSAAPAAKVDVAVISNGVIRDPVVKGATGQIAVCDAFRAIPLGIGFDAAETMGYPLITLYVYPSELKKTLEILTSIYPLKGSDYYIQISGVRFRYNPHRMIFDRVTDIWLGDEETGYTPLDYSASNRTLLCVTADIYNATFLKIIGNFTWHVLDIVPKDRNGNPIEDLKTARIDADAATPGIQELKEWQAVIAYIANFADTDGDGIANVPDKYRHKLGRIAVDAGWNPYRLLRRGTYVTWTAFGLILLAGLAIVALGWFTVKKIRK
jgi:5'-nucleotidase/UDP-sugar diphosphatase